MVNLGVDFQLTVCQGAGDSIGFMGRLVVVSGTAGQRHSVDGIFSVWEPGQRPDLALEAFTRRIAASLPVVINGDGRQRRDLTHVSDVARAVELALRWPGPGAVVLNVGTGRNHSVLEVANTGKAGIRCQRQCPRNFLII